MFQFPTSILYLFKTQRILILWNVCIWIHRWFLNGYWNELFSLDNAANAELARSYAMSEWFQRFLINYKFVCVNSCRNDWNRWKKRWKWLRIVRSGSRFDHTRWKFHPHTNSTTPSWFHTRTLRFEIISEMAQKTYRQGKRRSWGRWDLNTRTSKTRLNKFWKFWVPIQSTESGESKFESLRVGWRLHTPMRFTRFSVLLVKKEKELNAKKNSWNCERRVVAVYSFKRLPSLYPPTHECVCVCGRVCGRVGWVWGRWKFPTQL
jgi:hypothetical protein